MKSQFQFVELSISYRHPKCYPYMSEQSKRQGTTSMVIPRLCSFLLTVLRTPAAEPPVNKKRTRTLFHKESGSGTNCFGGGWGTRTLDLCDVNAAL